MKRKIEDALFNALDKTIEVLFIATITFMVVFGAYVSFPWCLPIIIVFFFYFAKELYHASRL